MVVILYNGNINSKSEIKSKLNENLTQLSKCMQEISHRDCFDFEQQSVLDDLCREIFYYLSDLTDSINLLNN